MNHRLKPVCLTIEFITLFIVIPLLLFFIGTRREIYFTLWGGALYALVMLYTSPGFSWRTLWEGESWARPAQHRAFLRFLVLSIALALATLWLQPQRFMRFPLDHFSLWYAVIVLYPVLSVIPQELFFRSFYFRRYRGFVAEGWSGFVINGLMFGFSHIILNNWVAPTFCALGGMLIAHSYREHRSLQWAVIEHSLYGCWIFTVGIGWYFFTGNWRH